MRHERRTPTREEWKAMYKQMFLMYGAFYALLGIIMYVFRNYP